MSFSDVWFWTYQNSQDSSSRVTKLAIRRPARRGGGFPSIFGAKGPRELLSCGLIETRSDVEYLTVIKSSTGIIAYKYKGTETAP